MYSIYLLFILCIRNLSIILTLYIDLCGRELAVETWEVFLCIAFLYERLLFNIP